MYISELNLHGFKSFAKKEKLKVKDESIKDTLIDMANYALIALIVYEEEQEYGVDKEREISYMYGRKTWQEDH